MKSLVPGANMGENTIKNTDKHRRKYNQIQTKTQ